MPVGDIIQASIEFDYQGNANSYSFYLRLTEEVTPNKVITDAANFAEIQASAMQPLHNPFVDFACVIAREVFPQTSLPKVKKLTDISGNRSCTPVGDVLPGQCSAVVTLFGDIDNPTRSNRGRDYWTGACCGDQVNGEWENVVGYLEQLCEFYQTMGNSYAGMNGNVFDIGVFSRTRALPPGGPPQPPPIVPYFWPLLKVVGRGFVRTQRRRQPTGRCEEICEATIT